MDEPLKVIVYSPPPGDAARPLLRACDQILPPGTLDLVASIDELMARFQQRHDEVIAAVLIPQDRQRLLLIEALRQHLADTRLILVLPDRDELTLAAAHRLRPRFLTYANADPGEAASVLKKLLGVARGS